jgi:hypothetical protein
VRQGVQTTFGIGRPPVTDRFAADAQEVSDLGLGEALLAAAQGAKTQGVENFVGQQTSIG